MRIVVDTSVLIAVQNPSAALVDPRAGQPIDRLAARVEAFLLFASTGANHVIIPTPALSEFLVGVAMEDYQHYLDLFHGYSSIELAPFDQRAAVECALLVSAGERKQMGPDDLMQTKAKVNFDRQILAVGKSHNAEIIVSHDSTLLAKAESVGMTAQTFANFEIRPEQGDLLDSARSPSAP